MYKKSLFLQIYKLIYFLLKNSNLLFDNSHKVMVFFLNIHLLQYIIIYKILQCFQILKVLFLFPEVKSSWITKRDILWILVFMGFAVNYMIRINLNIAIVAMVKAKVVSLENIATSSECLREARLQAFNEEQLKLAMLENNTLLEVGPSLQIIKTNSTKICMQILKIFQFNSILFFINSYVNIALLKTV